MNKKYIILTAASLLMAGVANAQFGPSEPTPVPQCGEYMWAQSPCPEVQIKQKHDHTSLFASQGWDTVVAENGELILSCMPYVPVKYFNGQYTVDEITYDPADPTFSLGTRVERADDRFSATVAHLDHTFYFFGKPYTAFVLGANGMVSFDTTAANTMCAYIYSAPIPWPDGTTGAPGNLQHMRNAIYGVYEDTEPFSGNQGWTDPNWGIYYDVQGEYPCRKIVCSWNDLKQYGSATNKRGTYQIVCYEGTNIIEVHVKQRQANTAWQNGAGIIGIQNESGQPQEPDSTSGTSNSMVVSGSPAAFWPENKNTFNTDLTTAAYRFTPQGKAVINEYGWYRINPDGSNDTLNSDPANECYFEAMQGLQEGIEWDEAACPSLTLAHISGLTEPAQFVFYLTTQNVAGIEYSYSDTITVGIHNEPIDTTTTDTTGNGIRYLDATSSLANIYTGNAAIIVENITDEVLPTVQLYDVAGRLLTTTEAVYPGQRIQIPVTTKGTYLVQVGEHPAQRVVVLK